VAQGAPELVARSKKSYTGQILARAFERAKTGANGNGRESRRPG
jgi:hypothetical protein